MCRLEWRKYQRPHFARTARLYGAVKHYNKFSTEFRTTNQPSVLNEQDHTLRRNIYDLRVKDGIQWMGKLWVLALFGGIGTRYRDVWIDGTDGRTTFQRWSLLYEQPGRSFRLYPALGCKVGWLLFRK
ncbi:hypothetical protein [Telluribacter sp. SYSU D00476]|uniref:hypothetical protein n=1 Tax=Telluribacter sp. SYSU D00476 TaxID=2811430 RepID=UPI001FF30C11|nr:hypothetical protein [Telluribacter sp. SYSU D00476]